jgi:hypothetical protein
MKLSDVEWATLDQCATALEKLPGALPANRIKQELIERIARGEIGIRFDGDDTWSRDDLLTVLTGDYLSEGSFVKSQISRARERGDTAAEQSWSAREKKLRPYTPDYSLITIDRLPQHIAAKLELRIRDVVAVRPFAYLPSQKAVKRFLGRRPEAKESARWAIKELFPHGIPKGLKHSALVHAVNSKLEQSGKSKVSSDTVSRAIGVRSKHAKPQN